MSRLAVILYLTLTVALGPAMCCCTVKHWLPGLGGSTCCGHHAAAQPVEIQKSAASQHQHAGHHHPQVGNHQHCAAHHDCVAPSANADSPAVDPKPQPKPSQPHSDNCDCGLHRETMLSSCSVDSTTTLTTSAAFGFVLPSFGYALAPALPDLTAGRNHHFRPAKLDSMGILRAYGRLLC